MKKKSMKKCKNTLSFHVIQPLPGVRCSSLAIKRGKSDIREGLFFCQFLFTPRPFLVKFTVKFEFQNLIFPLPNIPSLRKSINKVKYGNGKTATNAYLSIGSILCFCFPSQEKQKHNLRKK